MSERLPRRLAAILYADVAGYSRLSGEDEDATHRILSEYLDLISATVESHGGSVMHYAGDAVLAKFDAVVDAMSAAVTIQGELKTHNAGLPAERRVEFRIGINLGDVIEDRGDIYGDGVNVAARLEALADAGGVCVSDAVRSAVGKKLDLDYDNIGEQEVKNIEEPVRVYRVVMKPKKKAGTSTLEEPPLPDKPSIAVLPFTNMSGDPEQEYFSDGITEDIITELSRSASLFVIARNSSFQFRGGAVDIAEVGRKLGVRYVVEGSVRKAGGRVRITAQLIEAATGNHVWAERYDRELEDIFAVQDEVTERIVWALAGRVEMAEVARSRRRPMENLEAYDLVLRGAELLHRYSRGKNDEAIPLFEKAVELEPSSATALTWLARAYRNSSQQGDASKLDLALHTAERALTAGDPDGQAEAFIASIIGMRGDVDRAEVHAEKALARSPNNPHNLRMKGFILLWQGRAAEALTIGERLRRLDPLDPPVVHELVALAHYLLGNFEQSLDAFRRWEPIDYHRGYANLSACLGELGRLEEARDAWRRCLELRPGFTLEQYERESPYRRSEDLKRWIQGLRKAGIVD